MGHAHFFRAQSALDERSLKTRWLAFHHDYPHIHIRDAAQHLNVSEAQLVATGCGDTTLGLAGDWIELLHKLPSLGQVMALTRNEHVVHERQVCYQRINVFGTICNALSEGFATRFSTERWRSGFAVSEETQCGPRRSLQFFGHEGNAVHKLYLTDDSNLEIYQTLIDKYRSDNQRAVQPVARISPPAPAQAHQRVDVEAFRKAWDALEKPHTFSALLERFAISHLQALRLAGRDRAWPVAINALQIILERVGEHALPIRIVVENPGVRQRHQGSIHHTIEVGSWHSVLDANFNLHVRVKAIGAAWVVRRPRICGAITGAATALELFDTCGKLMLRILGRRTTQIPEDLAWRLMVTALPPAMARNPSQYKKLSISGSSY